MRTIAVLGVVLASLGGCAGVLPSHNGGAADTTAAQGLGEGPLGEVPTTGAFGPDLLSPSHGG